MRQGVVEQHFQVAAVESPPGNEESLLRNVFPLIVANALPAGKTHQSRARRTQQVVKFAA